MKKQIDLNEVTGAECIGEKSNKYLTILIVFTLMWVALIAVCIAFYNRAAQIFLLAIVVCAFLILLCACEMINFIITPRQCVKKGKEAIYFWSARRWRKLAFAEIDEVRTNGNTINPYTTMRSIIDRGGLRVFDKHNNLYRIKYLYDPQGVKESIDKCFKKEEPKDSKQQKGKNK